MIRPDLCIQERHNANHFGNKANRTPDQIGTSMSALDVSA